MVSDLPWNIHPDLTRERLIAVAQLCVRGRSDAVLWQNADIGDNNWILGCRGFQAIRHQIISASGTVGWSWLAIVDNSMHLVFKIGDVPVRFYSGQADEPNRRTLRQDYPELKQLAMVFPDERRNLAYRLAVEVDVDGTVAAVKFVGLLGETPVMSWNIPFDDTNIKPLPVKLPSDGVALDAPLVRIPREGRSGKTEAG